MSWALGMFSAVSRRYCTCAFYLNIIGSRGLLSCRGQTNARLVCCHRLPKGAKGKHRCIRSYATSLGQLGTAIGPRSTGQTLRP
ncbi:hypothetical protein F4820DRAFT_401686 [Hypoxylon rubiginosum]|uniref:Uncharacterized protein n=1 Tax=Hypoxylon rubiginosum TaxID=110542 RepID=A0ACB9ZJ34_9PEZI|nr:hypothetical protein F4820DRAFT_401686 [Hypoxylon rubiginosum]